MTVLLLAAGALLLLGATFTNNNVNDQLARQRIFFPAKGSPALAPAAIGRYLNRYAGQQLLTGPQAKAFADHFIAEHLDAIGGGKTYAQVSAASLADPTDTKLETQRQLLFEGQTLRGLLLEAYAFSTIGEITHVAALTSLVLGAVCFTFLVLHLLVPVAGRRTPGADA
ncbi:MAG: hypothetical protein ACRDZ8_08720 [Acidimicrobiales bacterium]